MSDYLYRECTEHQEMRKVWNLLNVSGKLQLMTISEIYENFEYSVALVHRSILMDCIKYCVNSWCKRTIISHVSMVDLYLDNKIGIENVSKNTLQLVEQKGGVKMSGSEKKVWQLFVMFPIKPIGWIERSLNYSYEVGIFSNRTDEIFNSWVPNPYEKDRYASVT